MLAQTSPLGCDAILIFHSIHRVMKAEKVLKGARLDIRLMPVPRQLSSDCGLSIVFFLRDRKAVDAALALGCCLYEELHVLEGGVYRRLR